MQFRLNNRYRSLLKLLPATLLLAGTAVLTGCNDDVEGDAFYTFTGHTVSSYCHEDPQFSIFAELLDETGISSLLSTYGHYTLFLPGNDAFETYFARKNTTLGAMTLQEKLSLVYDHIIKSEGVDYTSDRFEEGALPETSMSENYLTLSFSTDITGSALMINVNKTVPVLEKDIELHNGVIHVVGDIIEPSQDFLVDAIEGDGHFTIFAEALRATGLNKETELIRDDDFVPLDASGTYVNGVNITCKTPTSKRYGYTLFAEPDDVMAANGITTLDGLVSYAERYYGTEDHGNYTSENNALHKFVAYHLLDRQMSTNSFLYNGACTVASYMNERCEYYETMYTYRMMEIKAGNRINTLKSGEYVGIEEHLSNISAVNGFAHSLTGMLVYDEDKMVNDVLNKRIRFDFYNVPPELTNNNIRWQLIGLDAQGWSAYTIPSDFCRNLTFTNDTHVTMWASDGWSNFEADELKLNGWYDFTLRMLPMPPGSYEVRMGYRQESWRGIAQLFVDDEIQGIPRDLRIAGTDPQVGWVEDVEGPQDAENDKAMRNRGYMKGPASVFTTQEGGTLRAHKGCLRIIIGQFTWQEYGAHYLRGKNVYDPNQEFHGDYIEIIPTSQIDREDIY